MASADVDPRAPVAVGEAYRCPLCSCSGADAVFHSSRVVGTPICEGCDADLGCLLEQDEREQDAVLDALERFTGLSFTHCRIRYYQEAIARYRFMLRPDNVAREVAEEVRYTQRTTEDTVAHWQRTLQEYEATLRKLLAHSR